MSTPWRWMFLALALAGCADGGADGGSRRVAGTLVDDANEGAFDTWDVLPANSADGSFVILAHGPDGASGAIRFLPADDASLTIVVEAEGTSSILELDPDGSVAGEAHAPAADALLAEVADDLAARQDEIVALVQMGDVAHDDGAAREALTGTSFDYVGCGFRRLISWASGWTLPAICERSTESTAELRLHVEVVGGELESAWWWVNGTAEPASWMTVSRDREALIWAIGHIPRSAVQRGIAVAFKHVSPDGVYTTSIVRFPAASWGIRIGGIELPRDAEP